MTHVRAHERKKPAKTPEYISKHQQLRAELAKAEADKAVNDFRDEVEWKTGPNALTLIAGKLKVLAGRLVN